MSMLTELFGPAAILMGLNEVKEKIKALPPSLREKKSYLLKEYEAITGIEVVSKDYNDVGA